MVRGQHARRARVGGAVRLTERARHLNMRGGLYADLPGIRVELREAEKLFRKRGWTIVDVTGKSIEEVARAIIDLRELKAD